MKCPNCGGTYFDPLTSMNKLWCFKCERFYPFPLKEGKKSILIDGLVGKKENEKDDFGFHSNSSK